jgi:hypothetical protein
MEPRVLLAVVTWTAGSSGFWDVAANWMDDQGKYRVPGAGGDVVINQPGVTVTYRSGTSAIHSLSSQDAVVLSGGTLTVIGSLQDSANVRLSGGTLSSAHVLAGTSIVASSSGTLDGVTVDGDLDVASHGGTVTVTHGLTLNGTAALGDATGTLGTLIFSGTQTLGGTGTVRFGGYVDVYDLLYSSVVGKGGALTIGPGVTVRGKTGQISGDGGLVNQGTIAADGAGGTITVSGATLTNSGTLAATGGGTLATAGTWVDAGTVSAAAGSTVNLGGTSSLGGGTVFSGPGALRLVGTLNNAGTTLALSPGSGPLVVAGGTIHGGTIASAGGTAVSNYGCTLDGVTVDGDLDVASHGGTVTVTHGLTLNGTAALGDAAGTTVGGLVFSGAQALGGTGTVRFGSYSDYYNGIYDAITGKGGALTIGPGVTVRGKTGQVSDDAGLVNQGTIAADVAGGTITASADGGVTNSGTLAAGPGNIDVAGGSLTNTGTLVATEGGTLNLKTSTLAIDASGILSVQPQSTVNVSASTAGSTTNVDLFKTQGVVNLIGAGKATAPQFLEVMSNDVGNVPAGFNRNFAYDTLSVAPGDFVRLTDVARNSGGSGQEALYVNTLVVHGGATLDLNSVHLYFRTASVDGTVIGGSPSRLAAGGPLSWGNPSAGDLQAPGQVDDWSLYGRAGQSIALVVNTGNGGVPTPVQPPLNYAQVTLLDPNGKQVAVSSNTQSGADASILGALLPADGTYHIRVQAAPGQPSSTGNYVLSAYDATVHTMSAGVNQVINGQINTPYSQDRWTFSALANQQIKFDLLATGSPTIKFDLTGPNGFVGFIGLTTSSGPVTLPTSGTYILSASGRGGAYAFRLDQTGQTDLSPGTPYQGALTGSDQAQLFRVNVTAPNPLLITLQDGHAADHNEVYVKFGAPPTRSDYQYRYTNLVARQPSIDG